jgi:hypothetical protein
MWCSSRMTTSVAAVKLPAADTQSNSQPSQCALVITPSKQSDNYAHVLLFNIKITLHCIHAFQVSHNEHRIFR